jgi:transcriptional regulator with XRE-family HTH domain
MTVKDKIIDLRIRSGLTQEQFAEKANIDLEQLKAVENGERLPDEDMRVAISQAFELSAYELTPDIDEQDEYDRQSEAENTIDTQLPYNPFFREGSEGNMGAASQPVAANYKSVLRTNGILMYVIPAIIGSTAITVLAFFVGFFFSNKLSLSTNAGIAGSILSLLSTALSFIFVRIFYYKAFSKLGIIDELKDKFWLFLTSQLSISGLVAYSFSKLFDKFFWAERINLPVTLTEVLSGFISSASTVLSAVLAIIITISLLYLFYSFVNKTATVNVSKYRISYICVICFTVAVLILTSLLGNHTRLLTIIMLILEALMTVLLIYLMNNSEKFNSKTLTVIVPIVFFAINCVYGAVYPLTALPA